LKPFKVADAGPDIINTLDLVTPVLLTLGFWPRNTPWSYKCKKIILYGSGALENPYTGEDNNCGTEISVLKEIFRI
jgi:hypothetical protein